MTVRPRSRTALAATAVAVTAALAGCSGGTPEPEESTPGALEAFFSDMYGDGDQESANAQMMRVEEIVAACMSEQGFEYTPVDYSSQPTISSEDEGPEEEWGTLEFAKKWGYGATTNPWGGGEAVEEPMPTEEWVDPNQEYVEAMSETEQQAYYAALYGNQEYTEGEEVEYDWTTAGCQGKAQHEVYEAGTDGDDYAALQEEMGAMYEQIQADERITAAAADWASCMADAGYPGFATIDDASNSIYERVNSLWEDAYAELDPETATEEDYKAIEDQVAEAQAAITEDEIATAVADVTCQQDVDYQAVQREVQREYEQEFYDAHADELEAWKAAYQDAQS